MDQDDLTIVCTALRECEEEIGMLESAPKVLGLYHDLPNKHGTSIVHFLVD